METRNLDKALDIVSKLLMGENVSESGANAKLYQEYNTNGEIYDIVHMSLKKMNLHLYEYKNSLYLSAGENNRVFGYSNEELRKEIGLRNNKELYLAYFVMYDILTFFYHSSEGGAYTEFARIDEIVTSVDAALSGLLNNETGIVMEEVDEEGFTQIALCWDELPTTGNDDAQEARASRGSKVGFVKMVLQFMVRQDLFIEAQGRYYPKERFMALAENYFEEYKGQLFMATKRREEE